MSDLATGVGISGALAVLGWALRWIRFSGALSVWALGAALFSAGGSPALALLASLLVAGGIANAVGRRQKPGSAVAVAGAGRSARGVLASGSVGLACVLAAPLSDVPVYWMAAMVGAFATAIASDVASEIDRGFARTAYRLPSLRAVPVGTSGAVSGAGSSAAAAATTAVAALASELGLLEPGIAGLVVLAALTGMLAASCAGGLLARQRAANDALSSLIGTSVGATLTFVLVAYLP